MKQVNITLILAVLMSMVGLTASAYEFCVKNEQGINIYYNYVNDGKDLEVAGTGTTNFLIIPEEVTYMNRTRKVTSIGAYSIGSAVDDKITSVIIPNTVTDIRNHAFAYCRALTSITIPNSVISIGQAAFGECKALTSVTIGNSVTSIGSQAFYNCSKLTSITIPNSVTSIGKGAFEGCTGLTSITIPNSVTSIEGNAFEGINISIVISLIKNPTSITGKASVFRTFSQNTYNNATLYVPYGTKDKYKATGGWQDFVFIEESAPTAIQNIMQDITLDGPAIIYNVKGELQTAPLDALPHGVYIVNGKTVVK